MGQREDGRWERPILFNGDMVRAIRDGRKTETRRPVKFFPGYEVPPARLGADASPMSCDWKQGKPAWFSRDGGCTCHPCARIQMAFEGNLLWVKETWAAFTPGTYYSPNDVNEIDMSPQGILKEYGADGAEIAYRADNDSSPNRWRPSIHMPRWASRILLEVTNVRVERLQHITEDGAKAEGVKPEPGRRAYPGSGAARVQSYRDGFIQTWDQIYAAKGLGWSENPWVWVYEFKVVEGGR